MVIELVAAVLMLLIIMPVARHIAENPVTRGWFINMFEALILFIRDRVARPAIGGHGADRFSLTSGRSSSSSSSTTCWG